MVKKNLPAMQETRVQFLGGKDTTEGLTLSDSVSFMPAENMYTYLRFCEERKYEPRTLHAAKVNFKYIDHRQLLSTCRNSENLVSIISSKKQASDHQNDKGEILL